MGMADIERKKGKFTEIVKGQSQKLRSKFRKAITGDEKKRVRDHVQEQPDYVKLFDKIAFTLGLLNILACEYFLVKLPTYFWLWYSLVIPLLILCRISHFKSLGWQYFLLDFCYFVLFCVFVNLFFFSDSQLFFKVCFIYANGPLTWAIVIWRNSLVFHDYDKITSVYIHFFPCILYYAGRWYGHKSISLFQNSSFIPLSTLYINKMECLTNGIGSCKSSKTVAVSFDKLMYSDYLIAALGYLFWQICYFTKTEIMDKMKLDSRPDLLTSLRWMSSDRKNFFAKFVLRICKKLRLLKSDEHFDSNKIKTKLIFMGAQFIYSVVTFIPTVILYNSQICHALFIIFIFIASAFNGASFYIEVFSKVYQLKIEKLLQIKKLTEAVANGIPIECCATEEKLDLKIPDNSRNEGEEIYENSIDAYSPISDYDNLTSSLINSVEFRIGEEAIRDTSRESETKEEVKEEDIYCNEDDIIVDRTKSVKVKRTDHLFAEGESERQYLSSDYATCVEITKDAYEKIKEKEKEKEKIRVEQLQEASMKTQDGREYLNVLIK